MTDNVAIRIRGLGKKYTLGGPQERYLTFRDAIVNSMKAPFKAFHRAPPAEDFWALKDISFDVDQGEIVGIIGRNGAGKSTLLKILSRITTPTEGTVELHGRVGSLLEVGTGFHPEMTGRENIFLNGSILGMKKAEIEEKFDEIVKFSEIGKFIDTPVKRYSSGMYVRLAFAVAAHLEPEILIVDEVLAVGDASFQKKCLGKMGEVAKEGRTVLFVSHQMDMIRALCTRGILLNNGIIIADNSSNETINQYLSLIRSDTQSSQFKVQDEKQYAIQILEGKVTDSTNNLKYEFDVFEKIIIELKYIVRKKFVGSVINLEIQRNGTLLALSFDTDLNQRVLEVREPGIYLCEIELPGSLFKSGNYFLSFNTGIINSTTYQRLENILSFEVKLLSQPSSFLSYADKRPGIIALPLMWKEVERMETDYAE